MNCMWIQGGLCLCHADCEQLLRLYDFMFVCIRYVDTITVDILSVAFYFPMSTQSCDEPGYVSLGHVWQNLIHTLCRGTVPICKCSPQDETIASNLFAAKSTTKQHSASRCWSWATHFNQELQPSWKKVCSETWWKLWTCLKNQNQNDSTYNKSCTLSELVCLEIVLVLISNYKHFIPFYRKADFDKLLDSCITIYLVLGNWSWHIVHDMCQPFILTIMMLQSVVRGWIPQCCCNTMLQFNVQQYTPLVLKRRFTQLLHTANRCKLTLPIVKPIQTDVFQYSITIMSVPACVGHHFPQCVSFLMLHMDVQ